MHNIFVDWAVDRQNQCLSIQPLEVYRKILNARERFVHAQLHQIDENNRIIFYWLSGMNKNGEKQKIKIRNGLEKKAVMH